MHQIIKVLTNDYGELTGWRENGTVQVALMYPLTWHVDGVGTQRVVLNSFDQPLNRPVAISDLND